MENLVILTLCEDKTCCCLSLRSTAVLISVVSFISCLFDVLFTDSNTDESSSMKEYSESLKTLLLTLFQMANMLLLLGCVIVTRQSAALNSATQYLIQRKAGNGVVFIRKENPLIIQIYIWYLLGFIVVGFISAILEFCLRTKVEGAWSFAIFVPEVIFLFVLFRCLSLVDDYKKHLDKD